MTFKGAELNYPVHEKEMLAIIRALDKWRSDLIGIPVLIYTDHKTLENFDTQKDLSRRQARWMEFTSQYDCKIVYIKGDENTVADALSRMTFDVDSLAMIPYLPEAEPVAVVLSGDDDALADPAMNPLSSSMVASTLSITADAELVSSIQQNYVNNPWCKRLLDAEFFPQGIHESGGLLYTGNRLIVPWVANIRELLFHLAHDVLGHFGFGKTYGSLRDSFYWPNIRQDLEQAYIPACADCQQNKGSTQKPMGPLHPLPVPDQRGDSVAIDFIRPLPEDEGFNCIVTFTDRLNSDIRVVPMRTNISAEDLAIIFFNEWYCENGLPLEIVSDRDKLFVSKFWQALHKLTGVKLKMSTAYHPVRGTLYEALRSHMNIHKYV
jgi:hypothetical protein